jgi:biopolymer transport protein TolR
MWRRKVKRSISADINMVPFTDVVLVLLVIFMVTTPLIIQGQVKVNLPKSSTKGAEAMPPATITVTSEGRIYLRDQEIMLDQLTALLKTEMGRQNEKAVIISADRAASHGRVVQVLDAAKAAGAERLGIATDQTK